MRTDHVAWNKGRLVGQKPPLKPKEIWSIRIRLQLADRARDLALFNLTLDSKLRGCDLTGLRVWDVFLGGAVAARAIVMQRKTQPLGESLQWYARSVVGRPDQTRVEPIEHNSRNDRI